jgi:hypothetical protein
MKWHLIFAIGFTIITSIPSFHASTPSPVKLPGVVALPVATPPTKLVGIGVVPPNAAPPPPAPVKWVDRLNVPVVVPAHPTRKISPVDLTGKHKH